MASVKAFIRTSAKNVEKVNIRFRLTDGRNIQFFHKSEIEINPDLFDKNNEIVKAKVIYPKELRTKFNNDVAERKSLIRSIYDNATGLTSELLNVKIDEALHPEKYLREESKPKTLFDVYELFLTSYRGTERMKQHYRSVKRILQRYELYKQKSVPSFAFTFESIDAELLRDVESFIHIEHTLFEKNPDIYIAVPDSRPPKQRGRNSTNKIFRYFRTVVRWAFEEKQTNIVSIPKFKIDQDVYGTPYFISIEERNTLYNCDLSERPQLAIQRDIFVFQCLVGCRVGDLLKLNKNSVINNAIEYVPRKTKEGRPVTVRVPLNATAKEIITKYSKCEGETLLPFIAEQNYNYAIKDIFEEAELTRMVTIINPTTGDEEKRPLNEIASSHLARRTFVGNLYKKVKDPNLVGALSGHVEGSRAFARYREIDEEMKIDLVKLLD
ncbi:MAG TPA: phage integrase SAM-like domain-containing protein [Prolixibacteraceae bacterium]|nr:phage integrase SAM-like domain-containing protein [Prolixibacteraceae bacterium]